MKLKAWEVVGGYGGGCKILDWSLESSERYAGGGGEVVVRVGCVGVPCAEGLKLRTRLRAWKPARL